MKQTNSRDEIFDKYIAIHDESLFWFLYRALDNTDEAVDLKQIIMEIAWKKIDTIRDLSCAKSWLFSIAYNQIMQKTGRKKKKVVDEFLSSDPEFSVENFAKESDGTMEKVVEKEDQQFRLAMLDKMDEEYKTIMLLYYIENISLKQIASMMDLKYSTTRVYLRRALEQAREICRKMEGGGKGEVKRKQKETQKREAQKRQQSNLGKPRI